ncbi:hypothetical protein RN11_3598 [Mycobacterium tuberculosis]|nr:hypothetical protein RN11_3598 [Mycobacterium tuberculosis]
MVPDEAVLHLLQQQGRFGGQQVGGAQGCGGSPDSSSNSSIRSSAAPRRPSRLSIPSAKGIGMGSIFAVTVPALRWWVALSFPASNPAG